MPLEVITLTCLLDNYSYIIRCSETGKTAVVDVPEAKPILDTLEAKEWDLDYILITHHHDDHIAGVDELRAETGAKVIGAAPDRYRLPELDEQVSDGDSFTLGAEEARIIDVSGHTVGHIAFIFDKALCAFTADSLMAWGCGRIFEGTMEQAWASLSKFLDMPRAMMIYSGHEYSSINAQFALDIEPENESYQRRALQVAQIRALGGQTVPTNLGVEFATNPFLRAGHENVKAALGMENATELEVFTELRNRKDRF